MMCYLVQPMTSPTGYIRVLRLVLVGPIPAGSALKLHENAVAKPSFERYAGRCYDKHPQVNIWVESAAFLEASSPNPLGCRSSIGVRSLVAPFGAGVTVCDAGTRLTTGALTATFRCAAPSPARICRSSQRPASSSSGNSSIGQAQSNRGPRGHKKDFVDAERLLKRLVAQ